MMQRAKADVKAGGTSVASAEPGWKPEKPLTIFERLFGKSESSGSSSASALAYASADVSSTGSLGSASQNIASLGTGGLYDRETAVYDISAHMVYLPDGTKLEAHSGLGSSLDDPHSANIRMRGVTPPHLYDLKPRESLFHGVAALRLNPVGGEGDHLWTRGLARSQLHARSQGRFQWLRFVPGLQRIPGCLSQQGHPQACRRRPSVRPLDLSAAL